MEEVCGSVEGYFYFLSSSGVNEAFAIVGLLCPVSKVCFHIGLKFEENSLKLFYTDRNHSIFIWFLVSN